MLMCACLIKELLYNSFRPQASHTAVGIVSGFVLRALRPVLFSIGPYSPACGGNIHTGPADISVRWIASLIYPFYIWQQFKLLVDVLVIRFITFSFVTIQYV